MMLIILILLGFLAAGVLLRKRSLRSKLLLGAAAVVGLLMLGTGSTARLLLALLGIGGVIWLWRKLNTAKPGKYRK